LLAVLFEEPGGERVAPLIAGSTMGAVNLSEVVAKLIDRGWDVAPARATVLRLRLEVAPLDKELAIETGLLRAATRTLGLSLGDRACLALARAEGATVLTADRTWAGLDLGVTIEVIR
jgi:PIN domain nuclease of toxin-antitoxin system